MKISVQSRNETRVEWKVRDRDLYTREGFYEKVTDNEFSIVKKASFEMEIATDIDRLFLKQCV